MAVAVISWIRVKGVAPRLSEVVGDMLEMLEGDGVVVPVVGLMGSGTVFEGWRRCV